MGGLKKVPPEGGSGGGRGHSGMEHWAETAEIKEAARAARRKGDERAIAEGLTDTGVERSASPQSIVRYRLEELAELAAELHLPTRRVDANRLDVFLEEGCVLAFCNLPSDNDTLVGFDGTPWHCHGVVQFLTSDTAYVECDELAILVGLGTGELVVVSQIIDGQLHDRWIAHKNERLNLRHIQPGEALRVFCLPTRGQKVEGRPG